LRFAEPEQTALVVPLSPVRIGFDSEWVHRKDGLDVLAKPEFEATLRLPNLERRFRIFATSDDLQEAPGAPVDEPNPLRVGARFLAGSKVGVEFGVRATSSPAAFAAVRWAP